MVLAVVVTAATLALVDRNGTAAIVATRTTGVATADVPPVVTGFATQE